MNLVNVGDERLEKFGDTRAYVFEDEEFTSARLNEVGRRLAGGLKSLGIGRGDHVVVSLSNSPEVFACFSAIWRLGAVIVPIMFLLGEEETRYILDHSDAKAVITSVDLLEKIENASKGINHIKYIIVLGGEAQGNQVDFHGLIEKYQPLQLTEEMTEDDVALMIYTSGTTGRPKGVMLSHNNLHHNALSTYEAGEAIIGDVALLCLPLAHSFGVVIMNAGFHSPFREGFGVLMRWFDPSEIAIIGIPDEKYGEEVMAFIVRMPDQDLSEDAVIEFAKSRMTPFKAPSRVKFVDGLPKSLVGKVLKKELRKML